MNIQLKSKTTIALEAYFDGKTLKSHNCDLGDWWGCDTCERVDITKEIENCSIPKGEYKITVSFERIDK